MKKQLLLELGLMLLGLLQVTASAQDIRTADRRNMRSSPLSVPGMHIPWEDVPEFLVGTSIQRLPAQIVSGFDTLLELASRAPGSYKGFFRHGLSRKDGHTRAKVSSQFNVIDTAIVLHAGDAYSPEGTWRHLYTFNAAGTRTSDLVQKLEGGLWVATFRQTNTFDASNNILSDLSEYWSDGLWKKTGESFTYAYDSSGNMLSQLRESWSQDQLERAWRYRYTYEPTPSRTYLLSTLTEQWTDGRWANYELETYSYSELGNVLLTKGVRAWQNDQWVGSRRISYTYDGKGNILTELYEQWLNGQWTNWLQLSNIYDSRGNSVTELEEYWLNGAWVQFQRRTYTFDANDNMSSWVSEWGPVGQAALGDRYTYTYDASGNMLVMVWEKWADGQWVHVARNTYAYDPDGRQLALLNEWWRTGEWVNFRRRTFAYDSRGNLITCRLDEWVNDSWTPANLGDGSSEFFVVTDGGGNRYFYGFCHSVTLKYNAIATGVHAEDGTAPGIYSLSQNYPNPFNPTTTIRYALPEHEHVRLSVFNNLGQELAKLVDGEVGPGNHKVTFDGEGLASGVYFYRLQAGKYTATRKFILMR